MLRLPRWFSMEHYMRNSSTLILTATTGAALMSAAGVNPATARITLNQCIASYENCRQICERDTPLPPPFRWFHCYNKCGDAHYACVDKAMEFSAGDGGPSRRQPRRPAGTTIPPPSILGEPPIFPRQPPAPSGTPPRPPSGSLR